MGAKVLFFITAGFPYGSGETFIENEITFLSEAFDKVVIVPLAQELGGEHEEHRLVPSNVVVKPSQSRQTGWFSVIQKLITERAVFVEFLQNILSNPLRNKILLKSLQRGLGISVFLDGLAQTYRDNEIFYYSYWLDDGAIGIAFINRNHPKVARAHGWDVYFERHPYNYLPLRKFLATKVGRILTVSENGRAYIAKKTAQSDKIHVSRLGIINKHPFDERVENDPLNIVSISSVIPLKRIDLIGNAGELINNERIRWNHFGDGSLLNQMRKDFPQAIFHGHIPNDGIKTILEHFSGNSVLINTSTTEGIPVSMMEAMSFGIPCIGTNVGGVSEIIEDGVNGFLMPANLTAETVAAYIQKYMDLPIESKKKLRLNAFKKWDEEYNAERNYRCFIEQVKSLRPTAAD